VFIGRLPLRKTDKLGQLPLLTIFVPNFCRGSWLFHFPRRDLFLAFAVSGDLPSRRVDSELCLLLGLALPVQGDTFRPLSSSPTA